LQTTRSLKLTDEPKKYLFPHLQPPDQTQYEADISALNAQFDAIEQKLKDIQVDCELTRRTTESQRERISSLADHVQSNLDTVKEHERKNRDELREIREEVDLIRDMLPKVAKSYSCLF
jgi:peroxin-14